MRRERTEEPQGRMETNDVTDGIRGRYRGTYTELERTGEVTHLRIDLHPDGGIDRFRAFGMSKEPWMLQT